MAMSQDRVAAIALVRSGDRVAARDRYGMMVSCPPLGNHQRIAAIHFVNVRGFRPNGRFESPIPKDMILTDEAHRLQIQFLQPDLGMALILTLGRHPIANVPGAAVIIKE